MDTLVTMLWAMEIGLGVLEAVDVDLPRPGTWSATLRWPLEGIESGDDWPPPIALLSLRLVQYEHQFAHFPTIVLRRFTMSGKSSSPVAPRPLDARLDPREEAAGLPIERLEAEITRLAAAECRWLLLVAEFDRREGWRAWGCASLAHWLGWQCGLDARAARERIRVARALLAFPAIREELAAGRPSYSKVRAITRVATPATEPDLVEMARHTTAAQTERIVAGYRRAFDPQRLADADERHRRREVTWFHDDDGTWVEHARLDPADGAFVRGILDSLTERSIRSSRARRAPCAVP